MPKQGGRHRSGTRLAPSADPPIEAPRATIAPPEGKYLYEMRWSGGAGMPRSEPQELRVANVRTEPDLVVQDHGWWSRDVGTTYRWSWSPQGASLLAAHVESGEREVRCTFARPVVAVRLPLRVGDSWETSTWCREDPKRTLTDRYRVEERSTFRLDGRSFPAYVLRRTTTNVTPLGYEQTTIKIQTFAPDLGLIVRVEQELSHGRNGVTELTKAHADS